MQLLGFLVAKGLGCIECLSGGFALFAGISLMSGVTTTNDGTGLGSMLLFLGLVAIMTGTVLLVTGLGVLRDRRWARRANVAVGCLIAGSAGIDGITNGWSGGNLVVVLIGLLLAALMYIPAVKDRCVF